MDGTDQPNTEATDQPNIEATDQPDGINISCISKPPPLHIKFKKYEARLKSFKEWPTSGKPDKKVMAEAGFFFYGPDDRTICYYCDGALNNWNVHDKPMHEHALNYPDCELVKKNRKK